MRIDEESEPITKGTTVAQIIIGCILAAVLIYFT